MTPRDDAVLATLLESLRERAAEAGAQAVLLTDPANVRYLSLFTSPEDARVLVTAERAVLLTDGRYTAQAAEESRLEPDITPTWMARVAELLGGAALAIEADALTVAAHRDLADALGQEPVALRGLLRAERAIKRPDEIAALRRAAEITDRAFERALEVLRPGVREIEVALELERAMRLEGADGKSFEFIVAGGPRSAMPHGVASQRTLERGDLVTLDFGAVVDGYHADMTRAVALGPVSDELRRMYDAVLEAQRAAVEMVAPGVDGREVDARAREVLAGHGLAEAFSHSLGHGVGLEVHEDPRLSSSRSDVLRPGMAVTVEPGVYVPGVGGVRIEDLMLVTDDGAERLSHSPKEFRQL